ncbi:MULTISPECIES: ABC transporter permease [Burkholderiaceae]|jgi:ribose transport system permease protein|uniref:Ribose ABC transport system, permease protein RbsC n=1 Tax=Caballeronia sordidicola TaxID=196367 RepID=A0A242N3V0_CABSO|nr:MULTISPECIES: ABC transporter permease [Burkholderiaceae]MDP9152976.1 ABC transporter permease [Pseudomonadota bacterium]AMH43925.1 ABC transporter permease [Burkholderia sp. PAMC 26561]AMM16307.1 ABC transporter permease [Burkholderia sp. PAMC 28687]OTP78335.1 Ribose ABC transport system, permease protein RbsC [Caballeronia sordidicola]OTP80357.1 Ribose ABC transport system, permease protein RbsC [Caballeronia sordidicola]
MTFAITQARLRALLPAISLVAVLVPILFLQPATLSYFGSSLLLNLAVPIVLATLAQLAIITVNDLDLSIGPFVSLVACIGATLLVKQPWLGVLALAGCVLAYAAVGALIELRQIPSIVVTLGLAFVWSGLAIVLLPSPGGTSPEWIGAAMNYQTPWIAAPIVWSALIALIGHLLLMRSSAGVRIRGAGGNPRAMRRFGWSLVRSKATLYGIAGFFGVLSGLSLLGLTTSADANLALRYTLLSIAAVILGGGEFVGGRVSVVGAVLGAITLTLAASFLAFLNISSDWQVGMQGAILIVVLSLRVLLQRGDRQ